MSQLDLFAAQPEPLTDAERYWHKHMARVYLQQARQSRIWGVAGSFNWTLLAWAANRRRLASA